MTDDNGQTPTPNPAPITTNPPGSIAWAEKYLTDTTIDAVDRPLDPDRDFDTDAIAIVEQQLRSLGYLTSTTNTPGDITEAVKQFQVDIELPEPFHGYGRIGPRTLSWLEIHAAIRAYDEINDAEDEEPAPAAPEVADTAPMAPVEDRLTLTPAEAKHARDVGLRVGLLIALVALAIFRVEPFGEWVWRTLGILYAGNAISGGLKSFADGLFGKIKPIRVKALSGWDLSFLGAVVIGEVFAYLFADDFGIARGLLSNATFLVSFVVIQVTLTIFEKKAR